MTEWELDRSRSGALRVGPGSRMPSQRSASPHRRQPPLCASIAAHASAQLIVPGAAVTAAPAPLEALAHDARQGFVLAAAAAQSLLAPSSHSQRRRKRQPSKQRSTAGHPPASPPALATAASTTHVADISAAAAPAAATMQQARAAQQFLAGGVAGAVSKTLVAPLERIATLVMVPASLHQRLSLPQAAAHAWQDGGVSGLYRGHAATLLRIFPSSAIQFAVFSGVKERFLAAQRARCGSAAGTARAVGESLSEQGQRQTAVGTPPRQPGSTAQQPPQQQLQDLATHERLIAGAAAGAAAASVCYPLEAVRTAMSVADGVRGGLPQAIAAVVAAQGPRALYRGFRASLIGDMLGNALGFTFYEAGQRWYRDVHGSVPPPSVRGLIGACSAAVVLTLTMPLEVARRRLQVQGLAGRPILYRGTVDCLRQVAHAEGLGGFYAASVPAYLKVPISMGLMYYSFELLMCSAPDAEPAGSPAAAAQPHAQPGAATHPHARHAGAPSSQPAAA